MRHLPAARLVVMALMVGPLAVQAFAQGGGWAGQRVITKLGTVLKVGKQATDDAGRNRDLAVSGRDRSKFRVYRVERANGPWLWLVAENEGVSGWTRVEQVVPFDQAIDYYTSEIRANPGSSAAYIRRGTVWYEKKEYDIAIADYNEAIRLDPKEDSAYVCRGNVWYAKKEYDRALADYNEAIRLDPKFAMAYGNRGLSWYFKKEYDKALTDYNEAIRLDPNDGFAYICRGNAWYAKREYDKALADYNEAIRLDPKFAMAYTNRGRAWAAKRDYDRALADSNEAIRLDPKFASAYRNRGNAWYAKKEYDKALANSNEAIRLDPKDAWAYIYRIRIFLETEREITLSDVRDWLDATGWRGEDAPYIVLLGHFCLRRAHRDDEARRLLDEAASKGNMANWPCPVIGYLRKEIDGKAMLAATDGDKMTEAQCFLGLDLILSGRPEEALPHLRWVKDHGNTGSIEYGIAVAELDRIEETKTAASRP